MRDHGLQRVLPSHRQNPSRPSRLIACLAVLHLTNELVDEYAATVVQYSHMVWDRRCGDPRIGKRHHLRLLQIDTLAALDDEPVEPRWASRRHGTPIRPFGPSY